MLEFQKGAYLILDLGVDVLDSLHQLFLPHSELDVLGLIPKAVLGHLSSGEVRGLLVAAGEEVLEGKVELQGGCRVAEGVMLRLEIDVEFRAERLQLMREARELLGGLEGAVVRLLEVNPDIERCYGGEDDPHVLIEIVADEELDGREGSPDLKGLLLVHPPSAPGLQEFLAEAVNSEGFDRGGVVRQNLQLERWSAVAVDDGELEQLL